MTWCLFRPECHLKDLPHSYICKASLYYEFSDDGNDQPITEILAADIYMISSTGGIDCALNVWNLAGKHFLMFCKKLNAMQKTYHLQKR